ncbi:hypothetical protein M5585_15205 [Serratia ureilytica]
MAAKGDIETHGKVYSGGQLAVQSREGMLTQSGTLAAAGNVHLNAARGIKAAATCWRAVMSKARWSMMPICSLIARAISAPVAVCSVKERQRVRAPGGYQRRAGCGRPHRAGGPRGRRGLRQSTVDSGELAVSTKGNVDAQQAKVKAGRWAVDADNLFNQQATWSQTGDGESRFTGRRAG